MVIPSAKAPDDRHQGTSTGVFLPSYLWVRIKTWVRAKFVLGSSK